MADEFVFAGRHDRTLGSGGTFTLPDEWRPGIAGGRVFYVLPDTGERCLDLLPGAVMERDLAAIRARARFGAEDLKALKAIAEATYRIVADDECRVEIPRRLREAMGMGGEVTLAGSVRMIKIRAKRASETV